MVKVIKLFSISIVILIVISLSLVLPVAAANPKNSEPSSYSSFNAAGYGGGYWGLIGIGISEYGELLYYGEGSIGLEYPSGYEHIATGTYLEGYLVAYKIDGDDNVAYSVFDERENFEEISYDVLEDSSNKLVVRVVTQTSDGAVTITQTFEMERDENYVDITIEVENTSGGYLCDVIFKRCADLDVDSGGYYGWADYYNIFDIDSGDDMVFAYTTDTYPYNPRPEGCESHYVGMAGSPEPDYFDVDNWDDYYQRESEVNVDSYPAEGDYTATLEWNLGMMVPEKNETVIVTYSVGDSFSDLQAAPSASPVGEDCDDVTASISASTTIGDAPLTVQFRGQSNISGVDYFWSFGTGDDSDSRSPSYTFQNEGTYEVFLTVTTPCGDTATDSITIMVDAQDVPPVLIVQDLNINPTYANYGEPVYITATVFNQGGSWGSQDMQLLINGQFEQSVPVGVAAGTGQAIDFTVYKTEAREYQVTIGEATGTFYLMEQAAQQTQSSGLLAGGDLGTGGIIAIICIGVILVGGVIIIFLFARRA